MKNTKGFVSVVLSIVLSIVIGVGALLALACPGDKQSQFDRAVAALQTAPALIESFRQATPEQQQKLKQYFTDAVSALRAYQAAKTDENWGAFVTVLASIASHKLSDAQGQARISAIVGLVKVILGVPDEALARAGRGGVVNVPQPDLKNIQEADVKRLEELMKPLPR